jgi:amino acid transporter
MLLAEIIVYTVFAYLAMGLLFSLYFSFFAVKKFDESAKDAGIGFRLVIFFGVVALWIIFAWRMIRGRKTPTEINAHRKIAREN